MESHFAKFTRYAVSWYFNIEIFARKKFSPILPPALIGNNLSQ